MRIELYRKIQMCLHLGIIQFTELIWKHLKSRNNYQITYNQSRLSFRKHSSDLEVFRQVFIKRDYHFKELNELNPKTIIDAGCNNGFSIVSFKKDFPDALVIGIEPAENNYQLAKVNTSAFKNVFLEKHALWYEKTTLPLNDPGKGDYAFSVTRKGKVNSIVETITIQDIIQKYMLQSIDLLKMDIEGAEKEIFNLGKNEWLSKVKCLIIEVHDRLEEGCSEALFRALRSYTYSVGFRGENFVIEFKHQ